MTQCQLFRTFERGSLILKYDKIKLRIKIKMNENKIRRNILFLCNVNRLRSPTAHEIYKFNVDLNVKSAGVSDLAIVKLTDELFEWADIIFVMDNEVQKKLKRKYYNKMMNKKIICLHIPDEYDYMDKELIEILKEKLSKIIGKPEYKEKES